MESENNPNYEDLLEIARMSEIEISDEELESLSGEIEDMLEFIGDLDDIDLGSIDKLFEDDE